MSNKTSDSNKEIPPVSAIEAAKKPEPETIETVADDIQTEILNAIKKLKQENEEIALRTETDPILELTDKKGISGATQEADEKAQNAGEKAKQDILSMGGKEQETTAPEPHQEETPNIAEKTEKKDTVKNTIKAAIFGLVAFYGGIIGGPGGAENDKNKEAVNLLNEISSQKIVAKANHEKLARYVLDTFNSIAGGQEAVAAEVQVPLKEITMDSKQLEENLQKSQAAWELWWKNHPEDKEAQIKEFDAWANYARLQAGDKVRILLRDQTQSSPSIKIFAITGESGEDSMLLSDFFKAMAKDLGDSYNPNNILNIEIDRDHQKSTGSLGFDSENPAYPLLTDYLQSHLPIGNFGKIDAPPVDLEDIENRTSLSKIPVQPYRYAFKSPPGGWVPAEKSPNATIADTILAPPPVMPPPKLGSFNPALPSLPSRTTGGIRPSPEAKPTPGGPPQITTINIGEKIKPVEKTTEKAKPTVVTNAPEKLPTMEKSPLSQDPAVKTFGDYLAEKLAINADDIDAVSGASWDKLTEKMPSLTINEGLFLSAEDQKNPQVVEHFKNLIISKGEQKLKEIEADLIKNFYFPAKSLSDPKAIYDFASDNLKDASKENKVAFFMLVNSHKRITDLRAEYTAEKK